MHHLFGSNKTSTSKTPSYKRASTRPSTSSGSTSYNNEYKLNSSPTALRHKPSFSTKPHTSGAVSQPTQPDRSRIDPTAVFLPQKHIQPAPPTPTQAQLPSAPIQLHIPPRREVSRSPAPSAEPASAASQASKPLPSPLPTPESTTSPNTLRSQPSYSNMLVRPSTGYQSISANGGNGQPSFAPMQPPSPTLETITYQHIQETSSKRISTLDYLRKAHEGRVYWFNTLLFTKPDLQKMPYFDSRKLARRATNYLLLGLSLPTVVDLNSSTALEFLKTLNALLSEFEAYQQIHPPEGAASSLSRARIPQMFKRGMTTSKTGRRTSSAAEIGLPMGNDSLDHKSSSTSNQNSAGTSYLVNETDLLPGEEYIHLLTPSLPFDPDFYETFATLCDVLIDCYTRLMGLVSSPRECSPLVAEMFTKADARVRKIIVQGVVKEFEDSSRQGLKSEVAGVGRVVLGGLM